MTEIQIDELTGFELRIRLHACRAAARDRARAGDADAAAAIAEVDRDLAAAVRDAVRRYERIAAPGRPAAGLPEPRRIAQPHRTATTGEPT